MQQTNAQNCPSGQMCIASGGSAITLSAKGETRGVDPLATNYEAGSEGDGMPSEGAITAESFPQEIPLPPTTSLPAEFECQLCYSTKKFTKPSDWTKHVHEDVQPFTCTWDRCRDPKIFKRKADWVRHEAEGHRVCFPTAQLCSATISHTNASHSILNGGSATWKTVDISATAATTSCSTSSESTSTLSLKSRPKPPSSEPGQRMLLGKRSKSATERRLAKRKTSHVASAARRCRTGRSSRSTWPSTWRA